jgi:hypothetical protein
MPGACMQHARLHICNTFRRSVLKRLQELNKLILGFEIWQMLNITVL